VSRVEPKSITGSKRINGSPIRLVALV